MDLNAVSTAYEAPALLELGSFEEVTKQTLHGNYFDVTITSHSHASPDILS